ncbi:hypothetical protein KUCAC02_006526 [Chaenocephalus aceratus]|uniref:Uncharacterized protein n=1 Tax=Chaenocephalus aceratus TaxID=36190 RepID=A0ACB9VTE1_CHAAC|nr:hypothetical protein KUCAC02_006526 [Chaenocephalus aceratus]
MAKSPEVKLAVFGRAGVGKSVLSAHSLCDMTRGDVATMGPAPAAAAQHWEPVSQWRVFLCLKGTKEPRGPSDGDVEGVTWLRLRTGFWCR